MPGTNDLPRTYLAPLPRPRRVLWLLRQALIGSYEDGVIGFAKGAAYSALLAFFPVFTSLTAILVQANAAEVSHIITNFLFEAVPPGTEEIVRYNLTQEGARPLWLLVGAALISALAASGVMTSLMDGFQAIYRLPTGRSFWRQRLVAVLLVFGAALPVVGASALIVLGSRTEREISEWLGLLPAGEDLKGGVRWFGSIVRYAVSFAGIAAATALLYYFGPKRKQVWRHVWPGAWLATLLWLAVTAGFAWYVRNVATYNVLYGSIGAAIALIVWMYLLALIALFGCEYNAARERLLG
jgi:membrane protein